MYHTARKAMTTIAHLIGPGVLRVRNGMPAWEPLEGASLLLHPERLETLIVYGHGDLTGEAVRLLWRHGVQVGFLSRSGSRMQGRLCPPAAKAPSLAHLQHLAVADPAFALRESRRLVEQKLQGIRDAMQHLARHGQSELRTVREQLKIDLRRLAKASSLDSLRGHEGAASARWHAQMRRLFPAHLTYPGRRYHPATDPVNAMLSLGYTMLLGRVQAQAAAVGLDPLVGVFHQPRAGKPALACDLIEPFRTPVVDQLVLGQVRQGFFLRQHFTSTERGVRLTKDHFRRFVEAFEQRFTGQPKQEPFQAQVRRIIADFAASVRCWARDNRPPGG